MAVWTIQLEKQVDDSWILTNDWNGNNFGTTPVAEDFEIISFDFATTLPGAASFAGNVDGAQIINDLVYAGQRAKNSLPIYNVEITKTLLSGVENFYFVITRSDGWIQEAWQPLSATSVILEMSLSPTDEQLLPDYTNSTVDFAFYPLEPDNPQNALIDIYENVDGTWQAVVTVDGTEILNDDYPSEELAHQAAQTAIAAL